MLFKPLTSFAYQAKVFWNGTIESYRTTIIIDSCLFFIDFRYLGLPLKLTDLCHTYDPISIKIQGFSGLGRVVKFNGPLQIGTFEDVEGCTYFWRSDSLQRQNQVF